MHTTEFRWVEFYIPTAGLDCDEFRRDIIETVEAHSRPDRNSPVVAIFKGGTTSALLQDNIPRKWDFFVLQCKVRTKSANLCLCP